MPPNNAEIWLRRAATHGDTISTALAAITIMLAAQLMLLPALAALWNGARP